MLRLLALVANWLAGEVDVDAEAASVRLERGDACSATAAVLRALADMAARGIGDRTAVAEEGRTLDTEGWCWSRADRRADPVTDAA